MMSESFISYQGSYWFFEWAWENYEFRFLKDVLELKKACKNILLISMYIRVTKS